MRAVVGSIVVMAVAGCYRGTPPPPPVRAAPPHVQRRPIANADSLAYLPADSDMVIVLDVARLRASPAWPRVQAMAVKRFQNLTAGCGVDEASELQRVSVGIRTLQTKPSGIIVIRGSHRRRVLRCLAARTDVKLTEVDGAILMDGRTHSVGVFADPHTLVLEVGADATPSTVRAAIANGAPLRDSPAFIELGSGVENTHPSWFVIGGSAMQSSALGSLLGGPPRAVIGGFDVDDGVVAELRFRFERPDLATTAAATLGRQTTQIKSVFMNLDVAAEDLDAVLRVRMSRAQLDQILGMFAP